MFNRVLNVLLCLFIIDAETPFVFKAKNMHNSNLLVRQKRENSYSRLCECKIKTSLWYRPHFTLFFSFTFTTAFLIVSNQQLKHSSQITAPLLKKHSLQRDISPPFFLSSLFRSPLLWNVTQRPFSQRLIVGKNRTGIGN